MDKTRKLSLPSPEDQSNIEIETSTSILFVGANGSGKTRLGAWIEMISPQKELVHRISAQKQLSMPDTTTPMSIDLAEKDLLYGHVEGNWHHKLPHKRAGKPAISMQNDFNQLMVFIFSDHTEESAKYLSASKNSSVRVDPPETKLDKIKVIWEKILPHRELVLGGLRLLTNVRDQPDKIYNSSEMSDGERVIFYLIGQCLAAPVNGIIVIDEPELHLHKSVQAPLWSEIEKSRPDCLFVYLTHDVAFAAAQEAAKRIWLKSFDGERWDWEDIEDDEMLPQDLLIEVLGSRKPVVFVEGENGSHDVSLYRELFSKHLVIPRGGCEQVIQTVRALKANTQMHHLEVFGLIDRDRRTEREVCALEKDSIYVLDVAEVENLFCTKEILEIVSHRLARNSDEDFDKISNLVFKRLKDEMEVQVSLKSVSEIRFMLKKFDEKGRGADNIKNLLHELVSGIDVESLYSAFEGEFQKIVSEKDYEGLLRLYNRKSLSDQVGDALGLTRDNKLSELVVRLSRGECRDDIILALKKYFGNFGDRLG